MQYDSGNKLNDELYIQIKNNCWKGSKADWVIICDADEFVYHPLINEILRNTEFTAFTPIWYEMFSKNFPDTCGQIYEQVTMGYEAWPKLNLFRPSELRQINYEIGCHMAHPEGNVILNYVKSGIKTLHMRHLGVDYIVERNGRYAKRMSVQNKKNGWGWHFTQSPDQLREGFKTEYALTKEVV